GRAAQLAQVTHQSFSALDQFRGVAEELAGVDGLAARQPVEGAGEEVGQRLLRRERRRLPEGAEIRGGWHGADPRSFRSLSTARRHSTRSAPALLPVFALISANASPSKKRASIPSRCASGSRSSAAARRAADSSRSALCPGALPPAIRPAITREP